MSGGSRPSPASAHPMHALGVALVVAAAASLHACRATSDFHLHGPPASVAVFPRDTSITEGGSFTLRTTVLDAQGDALRDEPPTFTSTDTTVLVVSTGGVVTGVGGGSAAIRVAAGNAVNGALVSVADTTIIAELTLLPQPFDVGIGPLGAYVTTLTAVVPLDLATLTLGQAAAGVSGTPVHVVFDSAGDRAYVSNEALLGVSVVDVVANAQVDTIHTNNVAVPLGVIGGALFVGTTSDFLFRIDLATKLATDSTPLRGTAYHLLVDPPDATVFATTWDPYDGTTGDVLVVNGVTMAVVRSIHVGGNPEAMVLSPDRQMVYVANASVPYLVGIAVASGAATDTIRLFAPAFGLAISSDGARLYAGLADSGRVEVIDRATRTRVRLIAVGGTPREVRYDAAHARVLVANEGGWLDVLRP